MPSSQSMINTVPQQRWAPKPDLQPCWSIWASTPANNLGSQNLTPPRDTESRFWPREGPIQNRHMHSPPLFNGSNDFEAAHMALASRLPRTPPLTPEANSSYMTPIMADRSYLINCKGPLFIVQFKGNRSEVFTGTPGIKHYENELVIVEADRGQDLGRIFKVNVSHDYAGQLKLRQHEKRSAILNACGSKETPAAAAPFIPNNILRCATNNEINEINQKLADERKAVAFCCQKVTERGLDMTVLDAEFQWDRRKLTFFYKACHRIDFRDLVRELFRTYKTRIWMCAIAAE